MALELRTLLLTDLVNSTALVDQVGDRRAAEIGARFDRVSRDLLVEHDGTEIDKTDGFLLLFDRPLDAVGYALSMHEALEGLTEEMGVPIQARCGLHLGEVTLRQNPVEDVARGAKPLEVEGLAKPLAARVMSLAEGGQTLLTRTAFDVAQRGAQGEERFAGVSWRVHGRYRLKGVSRAVEICEVGVPGRAPLVPPASAEKAKRVGEGRGLGRRLGGLAVVLAGGALLAAGALWMADPGGRRTAAYPEMNHGMNGVEPAGVALADPPPFGLSYYTVDTVGDQVVSWRWPTEEVLMGSTLRGLAPKVVAVFEDGRLRKTEHRTPAGSLIYEHRFEHLANHQSVERATTPHGVPIQVPGASSRESAMLYTWDPDTGLANRMQEVDRTTLESVGLPAMVFTRDDRGLVVRQDIVDEEGNPQVGPQGYVAQRFTHDAGGWVTKIEFLGFGDVPVPSRAEGCATISAERDERHRRVHLACLGPDGEPAPLGSSGCFQKRLVYGENTVETQCLDGDGELQPTSEGWTIRVDEYGEHGRLVAMSHYDAERAPALDKEGVHRVEVKRDEFGRVVQFGPLLGVDGEPVWSQTHGYGHSTRYADHGKATAIAYRGRDGGIGAGPEGHAITRFEYDEAGRLTAVRFHGPDQEPMLSQLDWTHYPAVRLGTEASPAVEGRYHARVFTYSEDTSQPVREHFLDVDGEPMLVDGVASRTFEYDERGHWIRRAHFDADGEPTLGRVPGYVSSKSIWCHRHDRVLDERGRTDQRICIGRDGNRRMSERGYAAVLFRNRDMPGQQAETRFEDAEGNLVNAATGYARHVHEYDGSGNVTAHLSYDVDGQPVGGDDGCARLVSAYDAYENKIESCCFDATGAQAVSGAFGAHCERKDFDRRGRRVRMWRVDANEELVVGAYGWAEARWEYPGPTQRDTRVRFYDAGGEPVSHSAGFARQDVAYDRQGNIVRLQYFDVDDAPVEITGGCATTEQEFDERGNRTRVRGLDAEGAPCPLGDGEASEYTFAYDRQGRVIREDSYDGGGNRFEVDGVATVLSRYDKHGNLASTRQLDLEGEAVTTDGCAERRMDWDHAGRMTREACYDAEGRLTPARRGVAEWQRTYDAYSEEEPASESAFDVDGQPTLSDEGYHRVETDFDSRQRILEERWFGVDDRPIQGPDGCVRKVYERDERGTVTEEICEEG